MAYPESLHPYLNDTDDTQTWTSTTPATNQLRVNFDVQTAVELDYDYIHVMDGSDNEVPGSPFTGDVLAGRSIFVPGDTVKIRLVSDSSETDWGYAVSSIEEITLPTITELVADGIGGSGYPYNKFGPFIRGNSVFMFALSSDSDTWQKDKIQCWHSPDFAQTWQLEDDAHSPAIPHNHPPITQVEGAKDNYHDWFSSFDCCGYGGNIYVAHVDEDDKVVVSRFNTTTCLWEEPFNAGPTALLDASCFTVTPVNYDSYRPPATLWYNALYTHPIFIESGSDGTLYILFAGGETATNVVDWRTSLPRLDFYCVSLSQAGVWGTPENVTQPLYSQVGSDPEDQGISPVGMVLGRSAVGEEYLHFFYLEITDNFTDVYGDHVKGVALTTRALDVKSDTLSSMELVTYTNGNGMGFTRAVPVRAERGEATEVAIGVYRTSEEYLSQSGHCNWSVFRKASPDGAWVGDTLIVFNPNITPTDAYPEDHPVAGLGSTDDSDFDFGAYQNQAVLPPDLSSPTLYGWMDTNGPGYRPRLKVGLIAPSSDYMLLQYSGRFYGLHSYALWRWDFDGSAWGAQFYQRFWGSDTDPVEYQVDAQGYLLGSQLANVRAPMYLEASTTTSTTTTTTTSSATTATTTTAEVPTSTDCVAEMRKLPGETLYATLNWAPWLATGDAVATSTWALSDGLTAVSSSLTAALTKLTFSGGTAGLDYTIRNTVTTQTGLTEVRSIIVKVRRCSTTTTTTTTTSTTTTSTSTTTTTTTT